jgi:hypothetical protein
MIKLNTVYSIDNGANSVVFTEGKKGSITGTHNEGTMTGFLEGNVFTGTFHNTKVNATGLMEITFLENGFDAKWKSGLEPGRMNGKWVGKIENTSDFIVSIPDEIKILLQDYLIQPKVGIDAVYNWFYGYYTNQFSGEEFHAEMCLFKNELDDRFSGIKEKNARTIGIDFPILLSKGKNRPVLMICAMDPLREDSSDSSKIDEISFWVPFSIINSMESKQNKPSDRSNLSFFHTLLETHDVYVTDIFKVFYREGQSISNTQKEFKQLSVHKDILEREIKIVNPQAILTLGNDARDAICQIMDVKPPAWSDEIHSTTSKENFNIIMVPHISGSARGSKAPILNNERYKAIEGIDNLKYARIILSALEAK